jgi:ubiquinol-cytochrome c reductase iron-sulfur subunit
MSEQEQTLGPPTAADGAPGDGVAGDGVAGDGHRTRVSMPVARLSDPHLQDSALHPQRTEKLIAVFLLLGIAGVAGFGAAYWQNADPWIQAVTFGAGLFFLGFGLTAWGKYLMPRGPFIEERHVLRSTDEERDLMAAALVERTGVVVKRRRMLGGLLATGFGIFGIVAMFPLLRSMGPVPGDTFAVTDWKKGSRLVDSNGRPVHRDDLQPGAILTVFPEGYAQNDDDRSVDQTVLIRLQKTPVKTVSQGGELPDGRESWTPAGYIAYSKMCTHLGCPVGLYEQELQLLVCPCHQSMFNVRNGAVPEFGPAPRPLPQLPLAVDSDGYLVTQAGYDQSVGPGYWERTNQGNGSA